LGDWPKGVGLLRLQEVDSTNEEARRRAAAGETGPVWIVAERQSKGRGRQGRVWAEASGNLFATLLMRPPAEAAQAPLLSFAACLAVGSFFESQGLKAGMKWPNDPLINGGKAAGVLLEGGGAGGKLDWLAIGIGVNLANHPERDTAAIHPPTSVMAETGKLIAVDDALTAIAISFDHWSTILFRDGFAPLRDAWLGRAVNLGKRIQARMPGETVEGVFEDVDMDGALVLRTPRGSRRLHAADIYFS
jgi:BirA family biotin operon repressor/biotin-[acetyl-CoA-carboxylase] ligase